MLEGASIIYNSNVSVNTKPHHTGRYFTIPNATTLSSLHDTAHNYTSPDETARYLSFFTSLHSTKHYATLPYPATLNPTLLDRTALCVTRRNPPHSTQHYPTLRCLTYFTLLHLAKLHATLTYGAQQQSIKLCKFNNLELSEVSAFRNAKRTNSSPFPRVVQHFVNCVLGH